MKNDDHYDQEYYRFQLNYHCGSQLNGGPFSILSKGMHKKTHKSVIIVTLFKKPVIVPEEVKILKKLHKIPGIVHYIDHYHITNDTHYIVLEYFRAITLKAYISVYGRLSQIQAQKVFSQIIQIVQHCSDLNILHRNIKPGNILINKITFQIKLTNFGSSCFYGLQPLKSRVWYAIAPPEYFTQKSYTADGLNIWNLGLLLYKMLFHKNPFETVHDIIFSPCQIPIQFKISLEIKTLLLWTLEKNLIKRVTSKELCIQPWVKK